jgi:hypothetical protein
MAAAATTTSDPSTRSVIPATLFRRSGTGSGSVSGLVSLLFLGGIILVL